MTLTRQLCRFAETATQRLLLRASGVTGDVRHVLLTTRCPRDVVENFLLARAAAVVDKARQRGGVERGDVLSAVRALVLASDCPLYWKEAAVVAECLHDVGESRSREAALPLLIRAAEQLCDAASAPSGARPVIAMLASLQRVLEAAAEGDFTLPQAVDSCVRMLDSIPELPDAVRAAVLLHEAMWEFGRNVIDLGRISDAKVDEAIGKIIRAVDGSPRTRTRMMEAIKVREIEELRRRGKVSARDLSAPVVGILETRMAPTDVKRVETAFEVLGRVEQLISIREGGGRKTREGLEEAISGLIARGLHEAPEEVRVAIETAVSAVHVALHPHPMARICGVVALAVCAVSCRLRRYRPAADHELEQTAPLLARLCPGVSHRESKLEHLESLGFVITRDLRSGRCQVDESVFPTDMDSPADGLGDEEEDEGNTEELGSDNMQQVCKYYNESSRIMEELKDFLSGLPSRSLDVSSALAILNRACDIASGFQSTLNCIFQSNRWRRVITQLPNNGLLGIAEQCVILLRILQTCGREWRQRDIQGRLYARFEEIDEKIGNLLTSVLESMANAGDKLRQNIQGGGMGIRCEETVEDYPVTFMQIELDPLVTMRRSINQRRDRLRPQELTIVKNIILTENNQTANKIPQRFLLKHWTEDQSSTDYEEAKFETQQEITVNIASRPVSSPGLSSSAARAADEVSQEQQVYAKNPAEIIKDEQHEEIEIKTRILREQRQLLRQQIKESLKAKPQNESVHAVAKYRDPEGLPEVDQEETKYLLLARITKSMQSCVMNTLRRRDTHDRKPEDDIIEHQRLRFVFLMDNSGSMHGEMMSFSLTILTVFLEAFKRLEYDTAVVRFGGKATQTVLKGFNDEMDDARGQYIIESFDASEKTLAADAVKFVATSEELFGKTKEHNELRFVVLISDAIWSQTEAQDYQSYFDRAYAWPLILTTYPDKCKDPEVYEMTVSHARELLNNISGDSWCAIDPNEDLSMQITDVSNKIRMVTSSVPVDSKENTTSMVYTFSDLNKAPVPKAISPTALSTGKTEWGASIYASDINNPRESSSVDEDYVSSFLKKFYESMDNVKDVTEDQDVTESSVKAYAEVIISEEKKINTQSTTENITVSSVMDTVVLPDNRPTRAVQDYHGPTFSLRGFLRFICTDGQYKKIYESVTGHPRKDYRLSVVLDTSSSMTGMTAVGSAQAFLTLAAAMQNNGVEFNLMTVDSATYIVKDFDCEWDDVAKAKAANMLRLSEGSSNISDAVMYATQLVLQGGSPRTVRMVFVITDGYDSSPRRLRMSLAHAEEQGVLVVGIGIGYFSDAVCRYFPHYVIVNDPHLLPEGLRRLFAGEGGNENPTAEYAEEEGEVEFEGRKLTTFQEVWNLEMRKVYEEQVERNMSALQYVTCSIQKKTSILPVDLCFVMDTTGSMTPHIEMAQQYTVEMAETIRDFIKGYGRTAKLRVGFVTYKHFGDDGHLENHPLSEDMEPVMAMVKRMRATGGRGNEDKFNGLRIALDFQWEATAKFLVLIGDTPDHFMYDPYCCQEFRDGRSHRDIVKLAKEMAEKKIYLMYVRIVEETKEEEEVVKRAYEEAAGPEMKNGFITLDITQTGAAEQLNSMITGEIEKVIALDFM